MEGKVNIYRYIYIEGLELRAMLKFFLLLLFPAAAARLSLSATQPSTLHSPSFRSTHVGNPPPPPQLIAKSCRPPDPSNWSFVGCHAYLGRPCVCRQSQLDHRQPPWVIWRSRLSVQVTSDAVESSTAIFLAGILGWGKNVPIFLLGFLEILQYSLTVKPHSVNTHFVSILD